MILACHNLEKSFGDQVIVRHGSFHIEDHEKAALTGLNGAGKSTILKMITGELETAADAAAADFTISSPLQGKAIALEEVKDEVFSHPDSILRIWKTRSERQRRNLSL